MPGCFEYGSEASCSINCGEFRHWMTKYSLLSIYVYLSYVGREALQLSDS